MSLIKKLFNFLWLHKKLTLILAIILILLIYFLLPKNEKVIETSIIKRGTITQTVTASGSITSETSVNLSFLTSGKLVYVGAKQGDYVYAGQTIASLDQRTIRTNLEQSLRDYSKQRNSFDETNEDNQNRTPESALNSSMKRILENNQYDLDKAVNSVELQNLAIEQSFLISPINGILTRSDVQVPGLNITPANIFTINDPDNLVFNAEIDEVDISKISPGLQIKTIFDAFPERETSLFVDTIDFASHLSDAGATVYTVKAKIPDPLNYRLGMNGDIEIITEEKNNILIIPLASLLDENHIYLKKDGEYKLTKITTGIQSDTEIEVINGVKEGDEVVLVPDDVEGITKK